MSIKLKNNKIFSMGISQSKTKCQKASLSQYKSIIVNNNKNCQKSQLNMKPILGKIANTLPQIPIKSQRQIPIKTNRQSSTIKKRNISNNAESITSLKAAKNRTPLQVKNKRQILFPKAQNFGLVQGKKNIQNSQSIKKIAISQPKVKKIKRQQISRINQQLIFQRRQNYLNSYFNQRKNRLKEINKENKKIYVRINSQKSLYSSQQLNKSFQSNCSISSSKVSKRSRLSSLSKSITTSRASVNKKKQNSNFVHNKNDQRKSCITIQYQNVKNLKPEQINKFATLFQKQNIKKPILKASTKQNRPLLSSISMAKKEQISKEKIKSNQQQIVRQKSRSMFGNIQNQDGGILHRILQQPPSNKPNKIKLSKILV